MTRIRRLVIPILVVILVEAMFPPQIAELVATRSESVVLERTVLGHTFLWSPVPISSSDLRYYRVRVDWERYVLEHVLAITALALGLFAYERFLVWRGKKNPAARTSSDAMFTDQVVRDILAGKSAVTIDGFHYLVGPTSLRQANTVKMPIEHSDGSSSRLYVAREIPYPKELRELIEQRENERA